LWGHGLKQRETRGIKIQPKMADFCGFFKVFDATPAGVLVPRRGLEPPRLAALLPESSASTNSAIWATEAGI
jgi:hypothetical protein